MDATRRRVSIRNLNKYFRKKSEMGKLSMKYIDRTLVNGTDL